MIFRRKTVEVPLTNEAYSRWLRAQRPPFQWFLAQSDLEQEQMAILGDNYLVGCIETAQPPEDEEAMVRRLAAEAAQKLMNGTRQPSAPPQPISMGGLTERKQARAQAAQQQKDEGRSLMGRKPDSVKT